MSQFDTPIIKPFVKLLMLLLFLYSCNDNSNNYKHEDIKISYSVTSFGDSLYLTEIKHMSEFNGNMVVYDSKLSKFVVLNQELEFVRKFGVKGNAKNELLQVSSILTKNDTLIVKDSGHQCYKFYDSNGDFLSSTEYNKYIAPSNQFALSKDRIIDGSKNNIFIEFDRYTSDIIEQYGEMEQYSNKIQTAYRNCYSFYSDDNDKIFALSDNSPFVYIYNSSRELIDKFSYDNIDFIAKQQKLSELKYNKNKSYFTIVADAYLDGNRLYALISTNYDKYCANKIIVLNMSDNNYKIDKCMSLEGDVYSSICVINNRMYCFNAKSMAIEMYEI